MRVVYISDLHGRPAHFDLAFRQALAQEAGVLILAGDLVPVVRTLQAQLDWVQAVLRPRLEDHLARGGCPVLLLPGNHEYTATVQAYDDLAAAGLCLHAAGRVVRFGGWEFLGYARTIPSPWYVKDQERRDLPGDPPPAICRKPLADLGRGAWEVVSEAEWFASHPSIAEELAALPEPTDWRRTVFLCHSPPQQSGLDGTVQGLAVGSRAVAQFILRKQMPLALHGHVHEAPEMSGRCGCRLGATLCINAGQDLGGTCVATLDLSDPEGSWWHSQGLPLSADGLRPAPPVI